MMIFSKFFHDKNVLNFRDTHCFRKIAFADSINCRSYERQMGPINLHHVLTLTKDRDDISTLRLMSIDYNTSAATQLDSCPLICQQECGYWSVLISFSSIFCS